LTTRNADEPKKLKISNFSAHRVGDLVDSSTHDILLHDYEDALRTAEVLGTKTLMTLTNELGDGGVVINSFDNFTLEINHNAVVAGLKKMLQMTPEDMTLVVEPLYTVKDHVGYFLSDLRAAAAVIDEIGDSRLKILCDLYHQGMMGDDLEQDIVKFSKYIGYYHIADFPGRHEPGTGKGNWKQLLSVIRQTGYTGYAGFEYEPKGDSALSLSVISDFWNNL
jgi:hydroxypyruvate isomerase